MLNIAEAKNIIPKLFTIMAMFISGMFSFNEFTIVSAKVFPKKIIKNDIKSEKNPDRNITYAIIVTPIGLLFS